MFSIYAPRHYEKAAFPVEIAECRDGESGGAVLRLPPEALRLFRSCTKKIFFFPVKDGRICVLTESEWDQLTSGAKDIPVRSPAFRRLYSEAIVHKLDEADVFIPARLLAETGIGNSAVLAFGEHGCVLRRAVQDGTDEPG